MADGFVLRNGGDYVLRNGGDRILRNPDVSGVTIDGNHSLSLVGSIPDKKIKIVKEYELSATGRISRVIELRAVSKISRTVESYAVSRTSHIFEAFAKSKITKVYEGLAYGVGFVKIDNDDYEKARNIHESIKATKVAKIKRLFDEYMEADDEN